MNYPEILKAVLALIVAVTAARVGLYFFFRQKEYELVKQRYLEQGVDQVCSELESMLNVATSNWGRCLHVLKEFRDLGTAFNPANLDKGFIDYSSFKFSHVANHRVMRLLGTDLTWQLFQLCSSTHKSINDLCVFEVPAGLRLHAQGLISPEMRSTLVRQAETRIKDVLGKSDKYAELVSALQDIAIELERNPPRTKNISKFKDRESVKKILEGLRIHYKDELDGVRA